MTTKLVHCFNPPWTYGWWKGKIMCLTIYSKHSSILAEWLGTYYQRIPKSPASTLRGWKTHQKNLNQNGDHIIDIASRRGGFRHFFIESGMKTTCGNILKSSPFHPFLSSLYLRKSMNSAEECFICTALSQDSTRSNCETFQMNTKEFADSQCNPSIDVSMFSYVIFFTHVYSFL